MKSQAYNNFLKELGEQLIEDYKGEFSRLKVILPSKRAVVFFRYFLSESIEKSSWAPEIITISEWISELTQYEIMDKTALLFELFLVVKEYISEDAPIHKYYHHFQDLKFDNFYPFGETLLSDFNEMDAYNVDHKDIFRILKEHAEVESFFQYLSEEQIDVISHFWQGFTKDTLSNEQKGFIELWKFLPGLYEKLRAHLESIGKVYNGLNYKLAVNGIKESRLSFNKDYDYIFAGFNALNTCEISLLNSIQKVCNVSFYWDADRMYVDDPNHEAGYFIRALSKKFPDQKHKHHFPDRINVKDKEPFIHLVGAASIELQSKAMSEIMNKNSEVLDKVSTAIVLSDESFLLPVLYALPEQTQHLNVTMGYPITSSNIYSFVESYFAMHKDMSKHKSLGYVTIDILKLFRNPFLEKCFELTDIKDKVTYDKKKHFKPNEIVERVDIPLLKQLFKKVNSGNELLDNLKIFLDQLLTSEQDITSRFSDFEKEFFYNIYTHINMLSALLLNAKEQINQKSAYRIIQKGMASLRVPFTGEPISGMQIMGILETRTLDFKNLFILGLNEGIWPKVSTAPTLIPESIRRGFGLTTIQHQDSIFAYYFYRLLQRSEQVYLFYNNTIGDGKGKEMSRFITQLDKLHPELIASRRTIQIPLYSKGEQDIVIERTAEVIEKLFTYATSTERPMPSASSINQYLSCKLKFYFKNILRLKEPASEFEKISSREVGNLFHNTLEFLYQPYEGKQIRKAEITQLRKNVDLCLQQAYNKEFLGAKEKIYHLDGEDKIIAHLITNYVIKVLDHDLKRVPFTLVKTEYPFQRTIQIPTEKGDISVIINGLIDRIDEKEGSYYLIDYKTGKHDIKTVSSIGRIFNGSKKAIFQMFLYSFLYQQQFPMRKTIPLLYTIRSMRTDHIVCNKEAISFAPGDQETDLTEFVAELKKLLHEMFFSLTPFSKTEDVKECAYCPYIDICGR